MQNFANYFAEFTNGAIALRLLLAAVLGCVIGLERATKHHPAEFLKQNGLTVENIVK